MRLPAPLPAKLDRKAASLGRSKTEHVRAILEADVLGRGQTPKRFTSLSLKAAMLLASAPKIARRGELSSVDLLESVPDKREAT